MIKSVGKRFLSIALVIVMVLTLLPVIQMSADAKEIASGSGTWIDGVLSYSFYVNTEQDDDDYSQNDADGSVSPNGNTLTITATNAKQYTDTNDCGSDVIHKANPASTTVTVTNISGRPLRIDSLSADNANIVGVAQGDVLSPDASFIITVNAPVPVNTKVAETVTGSVTISAAVLTTVTITAAASPYVSYTLNGYEVAQNGENVSFDVDLGSQVSLPEITAPSGYTFLGWRVGSALVHDSFTADFVYTVYPVLVSGSSADNFKVGNQTYAFWEDAMGAAASGSDKTVVVNRDLTLTGNIMDNGVAPTGAVYTRPTADNGVEYLVPFGVTLLVPYDSANTLVKATPEVIYDKYETPTAYRTLTLDNGANIVVQGGGAISLASQLSSKGQMGGHNGTPTGPDGRISMASGSNITVQNGANLYAWGYITGSGSVAAESGGTVHEAFQIRDWRGGTATSNIYTYAFIFSQYYVQNIEVPLTLYAGASEKLFSSVNASSAAHTLGATFVGPGGLFNIDSGYIVKDYIERTDRLQVDAYGSVRVTPMTLNGLPIVGSISTTNYKLPINSNITINIHKDVTASITQNIELLPGVEINIEDGAAMTIPSGNSIYVYDNADWGNFTGSAKKYPLDYVAARNGAPVARNLVDAKIDVNGTVNVEGKLYTSAGGADITSSQGTGKILFATAPGTANATVNEMENNKTKTAVTFNPAKLHNGENSPLDDYTLSAGIPANTTVSWDTQYNGWYYHYKVVLDPNGGTGAAKAQFVPKQQSKGPAPENPFTREGYVFTGWNTAADGSGTAYAAGAQVTLTADTTLYAQWEINTYTVKWLNDDGTVLFEKAYNEGTAANPADYEGETPTKANDAYKYEFSSWSELSADNTFVAKYNKEALEYTVDLYFRVDGIEDEFGGSVTLAANKSMKLTASDTYKTNGVTYYFDHWEFGTDENHVQSYNAKIVTIRPYQEGHFTAYAVYTTTEKTDFKPFVMVIREENVGTNAVRKTLTYSITEGNTLEPGSVGFIVKNAQGQEIGSAYSANLKGVSGTFTATIRNLSEGDQIVACVTYTDANGDKIQIFES